MITNIPHGEHDPDTMLWCYDCKCWHPDKDFNLDSSRGSQRRNRDNKCKKKTSKNHDRRHLNKAMESK